MYKPKRLTLKNITTHAETVFEFRQGVPTVIVGKNLDDLGQKGNGSGKSGFIEGVAIAITGSPVRDASNKEIVRRGCESGEVELVLENTLYSCELTIWRKLYSGTKSAEVKVFDNGKEQVVADVKEYNKLIFSYLGISKEDFLNFFLLTRTTYQPFLAVGDTKKKEIINRFSGADKIDVTKQYVDEDIVQAKQVVDNCEQQRSMCVGKQQLLSEQILQEKVKYSSEEKKKLIQEKELLQNEMLQSIEDDEEKKVQAQQELVELEKVYQELVNEDLSLYDTHIDNFRADEKILQDNVKQEEAKIPLVQMKFDKEVQAIKQKDVANQQSLKTNRDARVDALNLQGELQVALADVIECPNCQHRFSVRDKQFNCAEAQEQLKEIEQMLTELDKDIKAGEELAHSIQQEKLVMNQKVLAEQTTIRNTIIDLKNQISQINTEINKVEVEKAGKEKKLREQFKLTEDKKFFIQTIANKQDKQLAFVENLVVEIGLIQDGQSEKIKELEEQLKRHMDDEQLLNDKLQEATTQLQSIEEWIINFKNFKSFLANQSIKNIEDYTNLYLQQMGTNLSIKIDGYRMLASKKLKEEINVSVLRNGLEDASYGTFSGGERARIDVAVILAIQRLINLNSCSNGLDLLILDEIMDSLDELGIELIINGLRAVEKTVLMVSQIQINSLEENTLIVKKENGISRLIQRDYL